MMTNAIQIGAFASTAAATVDDDAELQLAD